MKRRKSHLVVRHDDRAPADVQALARELRDGVAAAWGRFLSLDLRTARLVLVALVETGATVGHGGVIDRCRAVVLYRQRRGDDGGEGPQPGDITEEQRAHKVATSSGMAAARRAAGGKKRHGRRTRLGMLMGRP